MNKIKKISIIIYIILLINIFALNIFAGTSTAPVKNGNTVYGSVYINITSSKTYVETTANSAGNDSSDYVSVSALYSFLDLDVTNTGASYTTAYAYVTPSAFLYNTCYGKIQRGSIRSSGSTSASA